MLGGRGGRARQFSYKHFFRDKKKFREKKVVQQTMGGPENRKLGTSIISRVKLPCTSMVPRQTTSEISLLLEVWGGVARGLAWSELCCQLANSPFRKLKTVFQTAYSCT